MSASVDEAALAAELEAVREASRAGEIVAAHADDDRSMARYVAGATLRLALFVLFLFAVTVVAVLLG
ncbi:MAG TPA: hypothetical protein VF334_11225 [Polyangia bacterium]